MSDLNQPEHLLKHQYQNDANLQARISLHQRFGSNPMPWQRWVFDHLQLPASARVLELGCGPAMLWAENLDRIPSGWDITLSDFSAGMLAKARLHLQQSGHPFRFLCINAQDLPFASGAFDAVIANHMLYHVPNRGQALAEVRRLLKSGGRFFAATIGKGHMQELFDLVRRLAPNQDIFSLGFNRTAFTLESGGDQLASHFGTVSLHRFYDDLSVTETQPLVEYVRSMLSGFPVPETAYATLAEIMDEEIRQQGALHIGKATGLFVASA
ncbi:MAG: class I SAM-dependent methyltransferase [Chloroflexi bacterium]|nr:class I SAM-dependent methyltransferase [Chloroflexota bacterium]